MKKILFICPRNPFSERYSGDVIRAKKFIYSLSQNNYVKVISSDLKDSQKKESKLSYESFKEINCKFLPILTFLDLLEEAKTMQTLSNEQIESLRAWHKDPFKWEKTKGF